MINLQEQPVMIWYMPFGGEPQYYLNHQKLASLDEYHDYLNGHKHNVCILNASGKNVHNHSNISFSWGIDGECNINGKEVDYPKLQEFLSSCFKDHVHFAVTTDANTIQQISYIIYDELGPKLQYSFQNPAPVANGAPSINPTLNAKFEISDPLEMLKKFEISDHLEMLKKSDLTWKAPPPVNFNYDKGAQPLPYKMGHNVLENYQKLLNNRKAGMKTTPLEVPRSHQTLVIVYGSKEKQGDFYERAARLIGGFNTADTIKAVVITVSGSDVYHGLDFSHSASEGEPDEEEMRAMKNKFVQVVEVRDGA